MEHISLEVFNLDNNGSQFATLPDNTTITITETNEIFASGDVWSHSLTLNIFVNAHIFGTSGDIHGSRIHELIHKRKARLWIEGIPMYLGYLMLDDEVEVDANGDVSVKFESGQKTFDEMIAGAKANQVPMLDDVMFGMALWRERQGKSTLKLSALGRFSDGIEVEDPIVMSGTNKKEIEFSYNGDYTPVQKYPRMVYPKGRFYNRRTGEYEPINCLNTDYAYAEDEDGTPTHPYCNVALCYQKFGFKEKKENGELIDNYNKEPEAERNYEFMPANRVNSAPNFYVIYWIRSLMTYLGIHIEENQMMGVEDLKRLFFANTNCAYKEPDFTKHSDTDNRLSCDYKFSNGGARLITEQLGPEKSGHGSDIVNVSESKLYANAWETSRDDHPGYIINYPTLDSITIRVEEAYPKDRSEKEDYEKSNSFLHKAYASSECFPNVDIAEVIKAIQDGFGIKFIFDNNFKRVRIVLLRNIFDSNDVQDIDCDIIDDDEIVENNIRGFRMTYGESQSTDYYYKGFADALPHKKQLWPDTSDKHDYSHWDLNAYYENLKNNVTAFNKTCYVTPVTGNAYIVKVDKDASRYEKLYPSLFEAAGYMDAEDGDCSGEEETIKTINVGFKPAIMNKLVVTDRNNFDSGGKPVYALFVDEKMRPRRIDPQDGVNYNDSDADYPLDMFAKDVNGNYVYQAYMDDEEFVKPGEFYITSDTAVAKGNMKIEFTRNVSYEIRDADGNVETRYIPTNWYVKGLHVSGHIAEGYRLYLQDNFEPNDDGISPIETHDWGLTLGIMRGSGSDAEVVYQDDPYDGEGNRTWDIVPGSNVMSHSDSCDENGKLWSYTGGLTDKAPVSLLQTMWPDTNIDLVMNGNTQRNEDTYISSATVMTVTDANQDRIQLLLATTLGENHQTILYNGTIKQYAKRLSTKEDGSKRTRAEMKAYDASNEGFGILVETDSSNDRRDALLELEKRAFLNNDTSDYENPFGRISLKLRAEKPNPYYIQLPTIINTRAEAAKAMTALYKTADTDLLARPRVSNAVMREAGWNCPGDGYATVCAVAHNVQLSDGKTYKILWTPIKENGSVKTPAQLQSYVNTFNGKNQSVVQSSDTEKLILDIETTDQRASVLSGLQAVYYAEDGEVVDPVMLSSINPRYLTITKKELRNRGLSDQFYKAFSIFIRNAKVVKRPVHIELAQLQAIDKTKRAHIGDVTGFIRKWQYSVSQETGLGNVVMEIMYI